VLEMGVIEKVLLLIVVQQQKGATQVKLTGAIRLVQKYLFYFSDIFSN
jgi:hypothetical protein